MGKRAKKTGGPGSVTELIALGVIITAAFVWAAIKKGKDE